MNLLQILITPNEVLNNIITCIFAFAEAFFFCKFFTQILHIDATTNEKTIYIILTSLIGISVNFVFKNLFCDIANLIVFILLVHILFKQNMRNSFVALITSYITIFVSTYIAETFLTTIFKISVEEIINIPLYYCITGILALLVFYLIYCLIKRWKSIINFFKLPLKISTIISLILGIIAISIQTYIFSTYKDNLSFELKLITIISLSLYFFISLYSLIRTNKLEKTAQDLETEKLYNKTLTLLHDNIRCFKHDFNNIVQSIGGYIALNDMDGLSEYYKNLLEDCKLTNNLNVLNPETINNPSIYSLLTNKYYLAVEKGVQMTFDIFIDLSKINFNIYEFTRILGILLDNAIEAAQETDEKMVEVEFRSDNKKQLFIIANSCKDNNISTTKIFEKGYSTKENNSGIGLWKVHNILSKNTNIDLFTTVQNNIFKQQLEVFY